MWLENAHETPGSSLTCLDLMNEFGPIAHHRWATEQKMSSKSLKPTSWKVGKNEQIAILPIATAQSSCIKSLEYYMFAPKATDLAKMILNNDVRCKPILRPSTSVRVAACCESRIQRIQL